jgi:hypothetical protein
MAIQNTRCDAGVRYLDVRDSTPGPAGFPCLNRTNGGRCTTTCASFRAMTREEEAALDATYDAALAAVAAGLSPCCTAPLTGHEGPGVRHCSKCKAFVVRSCGRDEIAAGEEDL